MIYTTDNNLINRIPVINTLKEKDEEKGWERVLEWQLIDVKKGDILDIRVEFLAKNETARLRMKAVRVTSRIIGDCFSYNTNAEIEILEKGGQNICGDMHYWLCSRSSLYKIDKNYQSINIGLEIKAALQGALKTDYIDIGKTCWMQIKVN